MAPSKDQKFALVTGCGQGGIGEALVTEYTKRGLHAIATVLPQESSEHLTKAGITFFLLDVTVEQSIIDLKQKILALTGGRLDVLVNCAGIAYTMTAIDTQVASVKKMFDVNLFGPMQMVHYFHDMLIRSEGAVVNIGSVGGVVPYMYGSSYNASKAALHHWSNTLRLEMSPFNVRVITVISGEVGTNILKSDVNRQLPPGSYYMPLASEFTAHCNRVPKKTTDRFDYAANVVNQSLKASPAAWFWYGSATSIIRFFDMFAPRTFFDFIFWREFGLAKLQKAHRTNAAKKAV
ncbi:hypothetical protein B0T17DRAFT_655952 [Bombardia bombarda]|uniref:NAD(P)-binding protein n=1 Tax=Bombardia bombarda TaxID=252184 RepID=A0AA39WUU6_9PEZI|nr:hypothetical protein B0T17DRAFT_655952 [Bombardia bombarda]